MFTTAAELWQEEVGVRLHQRNYERVAAGWRAWQLAVLQAQEERRQAMLCYAADAHRWVAAVVAALKQQRLLVFFLPQAGQMASSVLQR